MSSSTCSCVNNTTFQLKPPVHKGIVSILGSDCDESGGTSGSSAAHSTSSIRRRTLSADMSSKNWLSIKKREEEEEEDDDELMKRQQPGQDEVWKAIQAQKQQGDGDHDHNKALAIRSSVSWSAILLSDQKVDLQDSVMPYIHPLLKKSSSCSLSKQSLQICTESLGSETGSDCLSSHTPPHSDHIQNQVQDDKETDKQEEDIFNHVKINYSRKSPSLPSSFPPPLPSLANSTVHLRSHRQQGQGGRLILEAVSIPQHNYFHAERSDGRLLLTALKSPGSQEQEAGDDEAEEFEIDNGSDDGSEEDEEFSQLAESSMVAGEGTDRATTPSFNSNTNHLYWSKSINTDSSSIAEYKQQEEGLIPLLRNCKEARRSLITWEPPNYCIATSS